MAKSKPERHGRPNLDERRSGWDRREGVDRRHKDRRVVAVSVEDDRRSGEDRRKNPTRVNRERRDVPDRRSSAWKILGG
jgi:hypothetical protein